MNHTITRPIEKITVTTSFVSMDPVSESLCLDFLSSCLTSLYGNDVSVEFTAGQPDDSDATAIIIAVPMDQDTMNDIEGALVRIFRNKFNVSCGDTSTALNAKAKINAVATHYMLRYEPQRELVTI